MVVPDILLEIAGQRDLVREVQQPLEWEEWVKLEIRPK